MNNRLGNHFDEIASITEKALWHARQNTKLFLDTNLDETAKVMLEDWFSTHSSSMFYLQFFKRYAVVFDRPDHLHCSWSCRNASACAVALLRELSDE
jgi:hypothetical protein